MAEAAAELLEYYAQGREIDRLSAGVGAVEFARTVEILTRTLPTPPAAVADIGGGPGAYTDWLLDAGYDVIHRDVVPAHVEHVMARHGRRVDTAVGDARSLDLADESVDAVLLLGPLYHLPQEIDRLRTLQEAHRVVRRDGFVYAAGISRWAPRLQGVLVNRVHEHHPAILGLLEEMERSGWMEPLEPGGFNGYAHTPDQLRAELEVSGLAVKQLVAVEGLSFAIHDLDDHLTDESKRSLLLDCLRAVESEPSLLGLGPHLLAVGRKA